MNGGFSGAEKRLEAVLRPGAASLRGRGGEFWRRVAGAAGAKVLSHLNSDRCDAWLLSESSLIVRDDRCVLITCGARSLADAAGLILGGDSPEQLAALVYERRLEPAADAAARFSLESAALQRLLRAPLTVKFPAPGHHQCFFRGAPAGAPERTLEATLRGIAPAAAARFGAEGDPESALAALDAALPGFRTDEHRFRPVGYSRNGLRGGEYYTLHVTPQPEIALATFESNLADPEICARVSGCLREIFSPREFRWAEYHGRELIRE